MRNLFILLFIAILSCTGNKTKVDTIYFNATVFTVDSAFSIANCIAVSDGKIAAIGDEQDIMNLYDSGNMVDLQGNYIYPGFNDAHCHFFSYAKNREFEADLKETKSFEEMIQRVTEFSKNHPFEWIVGRGWDQNDWPVQQFPDNDTLDILFPDVPVVLIRIDGHAVLANSEALKLTGITTDTFFDGGEIFKKDDKLTGILLDKAADYLKERIPPPGHKQMAFALLAAQEDLFAAGLTSITDAGQTKELILMYDSLHKSGSLKIKINAMIDPNEENFNYFLPNGVFKTDMLRVGTIKIYSDGALGSRGACLLDEYNDDPGNYGLIVESDSFYNDVCKRALDAGYQLSTHAIGDSAVRMVLNLYGEYLSGQNDKRWRIEHAQIVDPADLEKFSRFSIVPSVQATHATSDMYWADSRLGEKRIRNAYCYQQLLNENGWLPNGTDFPIEDISPIKTFIAAVFRKDHTGFPENGYMIENAISRTDALKSITIWPARAEFGENYKGSLEPGKDADFVVLDKDLMNAGFSDLINIRVLMTIVNGELVFQSDR
ncbi:MAG: amidohydrolase [Bacteroidota bacterium]